MRLICIWCRVSWVGAVDRGCLVPLLWFAWIPVASTRERSQTQPKLDLDHQPNRPPTDPQPPPNRHPTATQPTPGEVLGPVRLQRGDVHPEPRRLQERNGEGRAWAGRLVGCGLGWVIRLNQIATLPLALVQPAPVPPTPLPPPTPPPHPTPHPTRKTNQVTVRVMDIYKFMNSKTLFKDVRNRPKDQQPPMPVMVHISEMMMRGLWGDEMIWRWAAHIWCTTPIAIIGQTLTHPPPPPTHRLPSRQARADEGGHGILSEGRHGGAAAVPGRQRAGLLSFLHLELAPGPGGCHFILAIV
jgi:hypothetical protein